MLNNITLICKFYNIDVERQFFLLIVIIISPAAFEFILSSISSRFFRAQGEECIECARRIYDNY